MGERVVLVVDDNPAIRDMVSWALELDGYAPQAVCEGRAALNWMHNAAREGRYPAVILLDLAMSGMDGDAFLAYLRTEWKSLYPVPSVILITARAGVPNAQAMGVAYVFAKPFHVRDLLDAVHNLAN